MNVGNTAAVFAPNLLRSEEASMEQLQDTVHIVNLVGQLISNAQRVFQIAGAPLDHLTNSGSVSPVAGGQISSRGNSASSAECSGRYRLSSVGSSISLDNQSTTQQVAAAAAVTSSEPTGKPWYYLNSSHEQQGPVHGMDSVCVRFGGVV